MGKYSEQTKLLAVEDYWDGKAGLRAIAERHDVDVSSLRRWVTAYREHGVPGIQARNGKRPRYSSEFKLSVLHRVWNARPAPFERGTRSVSDTFPHSLAQERPVVFSSNRPFAQAF